MCGKVTKQICLGWVSEVLECLISHSGFPCVLVDTLCCNLADLGTFVGIKWLGTDTGSKPGLCTHLASLTLQYFSL